MVTVSSGPWAFFDDRPLSRVSRVRELMCPICVRVGALAMSAPSADELDPATVQGLVARASDPQRERWLQAAHRCAAFTVSADEGRTSHGGVYVLFGRQRLIHDQAGDASEPAATPTPQTPTRHLASLRLILVDQFGKSVQ